MPEVPQCTICRGPVDVERDRYTQGEDEKKITYSHACCGEVWAQQQRELAALQYQRDLAKVKLEIAEIEAECRRRRDASPGGSKSRGSADSPVEDEKEPPR